MELGSRNQGSDDREPTVAVGPRWQRIAVLLLVAVGVAVAWRLGAFGGLTMDNVERIDAWFDSLGWRAPLAFVLLWIAACVFLLPGLPISIAGGLVFGAVWGTVWTTIGANIGAVVAFLIGRHAARGIVERHILRDERLRKIDQGVARHGWRMLMITRLVPVFPFNIQNYVYGLTDIRLSTYALTSLVCMLPGTVAYNFAAGSVRTRDLGATLWYLAVAGVVFVVLSLVPGWLGRRFGPAGMADRPSACDGGARAEARRSATRPAPTGSDVTSR